MRRRELLKLGMGAALGLAAPAGSGCGRRPDGEPDAGDGPIAHALATAGPERLLVKLSLHAPLARPPRLSVGGARVEGRPTDSDGLFYEFDADGLTPDHAHELVLETAAGAALGTPWSLRTLPAPGARARRFRVLAYTCAGGADPLRDPLLRRVFLPSWIRRRLLRRGLSFAPDAVIANGDHIYWDLRTRGALVLGRSPIARWVAGSFDRSAPLLGGPNETVLKRAFGPQIAGLYGTLFRGVPVYFLQDDHDYTEDDRASEALRTFPPDRFMLEAARATQRLYYPEFLAPAGLPDTQRRSDGRSESVGALRCGRLAELLLFDCRRGLRGGPGGHLVSPEVEAWLADRLRTSDALHVAACPGVPVGWSAGKWGEWYPDAHGTDGRLSAQVAKPYWSPAWQAQHDRLLAAAASRRDRIPLFVNGDLHALAVGRIRRSGALDLREHPVVSVLTGPIGTGAVGWPSVARSQPARPSGVLDMDEVLAPLEENGMTLLDFTPDEVRVALFRWRPEDGESAIDRLEPFAEHSFRRPPAPSGG